MCTLGPSDHCSHTIGQAASEIMGKLDLPTMQYKELFAFSLLSFTKQGICA